MCRTFLMSMTKWVERQGSLDALCGPYAVANALYLCDLCDADVAFRSALRALALHRWPKVLWDGVTFGDIVRMLQACRRDLGLDRMRIRIPFLFDAPASAADYWRSLDALFAEGRWICAIIGLTRPTAHWTVVRRNGRRLMFFDADAEPAIFCKNRKSLHPGLRPPSRRQSAWLIDRRELVLVGLDPCTS
jgi:hypothetical protein